MNRAYKPQLGELARITWIAQQSGNHALYEAGQVIRVHDFVRRRTDDPKLRWCINGIWAHFEKYERTLTRGKIVVDPTGKVGSIELFDMHDPDAAVGRPILRILYPGGYERRSWYEDQIAFIQPETAPELPTLHSPHFQLRYETDAYGEGLALDGKIHSCLHLLHPFNEWAAKHFNENSNREVLLRWLELAYEKGRQSLKTDLQQLITPSSNQRIP